MGLGGLIGGALGFFGGGGIVGGLLGLAGGLLSSKGQKQSSAQSAQVQKESAESGAGRRRVAEARARRAKAAQIQTAMSFDGIGNEDGKIPFQKEPDEGKPLKQQASIFG